MRTIYLFLYHFIAVLLIETEQLLQQVGPHNISQCLTSKSVFGFKAWKCSESGYQRMLGQCAKFLAVTNRQKQYQIADISQTQLVFMLIVSHGKESFGAKSACCLMEFSSYEGVLSQALSNRKPAIFGGCDIVIVVRNSVDDFGFSRKKKRSVLPKMVSVNVHHVNDDKEMRLNVSGAILENFSVRVTREAVNSSVWKMSSKLNETELEKIRKRLSIRLSHDPQWAMVSMTVLILLILLAVKCCKLSDSNEADMEYVDYIDDWHTTTVNEAVGRKFAFIELIKKFKHRRKRKKKKNSEEKQGLLSKKRSHSDGEENILDETDDFIAL